jgi:cell division protein FtsN
MKVQQGGRFVMGLVVGLLIGLSLALGVALYVTKVPVPFINKVPQRTAEQDAAEAQKNRDWDPNSALRGRAVVPLPGAGPGASGVSGAAPSTKPTADPFIYFVQAGAYAQSEDAEQQRARLAMLGFEARLSEREQGGRTMFRVRVGPFEKKDDAENAKEKLAGAGVEAALVRVQK